jgi:hypothetical protein
MAMTLFALDMHLAFRLLLASDVEIETAPNELEEVCGGNNTETEAGRQEYETICEHVSCCWDLSSTNAWLEMSKLVFCGQRGRGARK